LSCKGKITGYKINRYNMFIDGQIKTPERYYEISTSGKKEGRTPCKGDFWIVVETERAARRDS